jgi:hypothetical protein
MDFVSVFAVFFGPIAGGTLSQGPQALGLHRDLGGPKPLSRAWGGYDDACK